MKFKSLLGWALLCWSLGAASTASADSTLHCLWEIHGKHNTVYLLGSIHTLRASDYPLAPAVLEAYRETRDALAERIRGRFGKAATFGG